MLAEEAGTTGNVGLTEAAGAPPVAWPGFRPMRVVAIDRETDSVISIRLASVDGRRCHPPCRVSSSRCGSSLDDSGSTATRSYSLSSATGSPEYRVSIKREPGGSVSGFVHTELRAGASSRSPPHAASFVLPERHQPRPADLRRNRRHAGSGHALRTGRGKVRPAGLVVARGAEFRRACLRQRSTRAARSTAERRVEICYSAPLPADQLGTDYTYRGRLNADLLMQLGPAARCQRLRVRTAGVHGRHRFGAHRSRAGTRPGADRGVRRRPGHHPWHRRRPHQCAPSARPGQPGPDHGSPSPAAASPCAGGRT